MLLSTKSLLEAKENIIVHQVNCQGKMNSGIAKQIREKWPVAYKDYVDFVNEWTAVRDRKDLLGHVRITQVEENKWVAHLFGQEYYGYDGKRYTSYDALSDGLTYIKKMAHLYNMSVALPFKIGCERGGGDWLIVDAIIQRAFANYQVHLYKLEEK